MNVSPREDLTPLTPQAFHVLLALSEGKMHGYNIKRQVEADSGGLVKMHGSAVYAILKRLEGVMLIEVAKVVAASGPKGESRYYRLTSVGKRVLETEIKRYQKAVSLYLERR